MLHQDAIGHAASIPCAAEIRALLERTFIGCVGCDWPRCMGPPCVPSGVRQVGGCAVLHQHIRPLIAAFCAPARLKCRFRSGGC